MTKRAVLLEALLSTPSDIRRIIGSMELRLGASPEDQGSPLQAAAEILFGLIRTEQEYQAVIRDSINSSDGILPIKDMASSELISLTELGETFQNIREQTLNLLRRLKPAEWQRAIRGPAKANLTVRYYVQALVENDIEQTSQLVKLVHAHRHKLIGDKKS